MLLYTHFKLPTMSGSQTPPGAFKALKLNQQLHHVDKV